MITINGVAFLGGVDVKRKPDRRGRRQARQLRHEAGESASRPGGVITRTTGSCTGTGATRDATANSTNAVLSQFLTAA